MDTLFDVRNNFYLGAFQQCINEAQKVKCKSEEEKELKDAFMYRAYIGLNKCSVPLGEIDATDGNGSTALLPIRRFATFMSGAPEKRSEIVDQVAKEFETKKYADNEICLLISTLIFMHGEKIEEALRVLNRTASDSLECAALRVQCLLKLNRGGQGGEANAGEMDEDATITQLAQAWLNMAMGRDS